MEQDCKKQSLAILNHRDERTEASVGVQSTGGMGLGLSNFGWKPLTNRGNIVDLYLVHLPNPSLNAIAQPQLKQHVTPA